MCVCWGLQAYLHNFSTYLHTLIRNTDHLPPHLPPGSPLIELKSQSPHEGDLVSGLTSCAIFPTLRRIISLPLGIDANRVLLCVFIILWASHLAMWILWSRAPQTSLHIGITGEFCLNENPVCIGLGWGPRATCLIRSQALVLYLVEKIYLCRYRGSLVSSALGSCSHLLGAVLFSKT